MSLCQAYDFSSQEIYYGFSEEAVCGVGRWAESVALEFLWTSRGPDGYEKIDISGASR